MGNNDLTKSYLNSEVQSYQLYDKSCLILQFAFLHQDSHQSQIALVKMWLKRYNLPFKDEDISYTFAETGYLKSFMIILDNQAMIEEYKITPGYPPGNLEKGKIKVVFEY